MRRPGRRDRQSRGRQSGAGDACPDNWSRSARRIASSSADWVHRLHQISRDSQIRAARSGVRPAWQTKASSRPPPRRPPGWPRIFSATVKPSISGIMPSRMNERKRVLGRLRGPHCISDERQGAPDATTVGCICQFAQHLLRRMQRLVALSSTTRTRKPLPDAAGQRSGRWAAPCACAASGKARGEIEGRALARDTLYPDPSVHTARTSFEAMVNPRPGAAIGCAWSCRPPGQTPRRSAPASPPGCRCRSRPP